MCRHLQLMHLPSFADRNTKSCPLGSWPISFYDQVTDTHFDYTSSLQNVTISDSRGLFMDGCKASSLYGVDDIVITDQDGYLLASLDGSSEATAGVFVSNNDFMKFDDCIEYPDNCLAFCPERCLRTVTYSVEQYWTEYLRLKVTGESYAMFHVQASLSFLLLLKLDLCFFAILDENGHVRYIPGNIEPGNPYEFSRAFRPRKFSASLPRGTYTAEFVDEEGNQVWPTFVEELWEATPDCPNSAGPLDVTLVKPPIDTSSCDELIRNGGQDEILEYEPWVHTDPGVAVG